jgi:hypothetical protein
MHNFKFFILEYIFTAPEVKMNDKVNEKDYISLWTKVKFHNMW